MNYKNLLKLNIKTESDELSNYGYKDANKVTDRRPIRRVCVEMALQRSRADEPHVTDGTAIRPLSRVDSEVALQRRRLGELLITHDAVVRAFTGVDALVLLQDAVLGELLAAYVADERAFAEVAAHVTLQSRQSDERRAALVTHMPVYTGEKSGRLSCGQNMICNTETSASH